MKHRANRFAALTVVPALALGLTLVEVGILSACAHPTKDANVAKAADSSALPETSTSVPAQAAGQTAAPSVPTQPTLDPMSPATYELTYSTSIPKPEGKFGKIEVWIPQPIDMPEQKVKATKVESPVPYTTHFEPKFGNSMIHLNLDETTTFPVELKMTFTVERTPTLPLAKGSFPAIAAWDPQKFRGVDRKIPINGLIAKISNEETVGLKTKDEKIQKIYAHVAESMTYNKDGTGWGQGDAVWACENKRGNCTDFHSLLIGMARAQKISAKFEMGLPIPPAGEGKIPGYHCWARIYSENQGWVPVDASESKKANDTMKFFGKFPSDRIHFTTGRDLQLEPKQKGAPLNYFVYPYTEVDGKPVELATRDFTVKRL